MEIRKHLVEIGGRLHEGGDAALRGTLCDRSEGCTLLLLGVVKDSGHILSFPTAKPIVVRLEESVQKFLIRHLTIVKVYLDGFGPIRKFRIGAHLECTML